MTVQYELREEESGITVVALSGQLNLGSRLTDLERNIKLRIESGARKMVLDLGGLTYIDSAGIGMVASCAKAMAKAGGRLTVAAVGKIHHMFEVTRLNRVIGVFPDLPSASSAASEPPASSSAEA